MYARVGGLGRTGRPSLPIGNPQQKSRPSDYAGSRSAIPLFPKSVPDCSFPKLPIRDGKAGMIAHNEWVRSLRGSASLSFDTGRFQANRFLP